MLMKLCEVCVPIRSKLFFVMLLNSILLVVTMYLLIQWTVDKELVKYINIREQQMFSVMTKSLSEQYEIEGGWGFLVQQPRLFHQILREADGRTAEYRDLERRPPPPEHRKPLSSNRPPHEYRENRALKPSQNERRVRRPPPKNELGFSLLNSEKEIIIGRYRLDGNYDLTAIESGSDTVGWLAFKRKRNPGDDFDFALQESLTEGFLLISALVLFLSATFVLPLTRFIVRRIKALTDGAKAISSGDLSYRVTVASKDEIGELGRDFNNLAQTLEQNESARKRWIADISHELRTPLAITSGELEAMEDGVRPLNIENIKSARDEIKHLQRLVNDLYELTNADIGAISYHKSPVDLIHLIQTESEHFALLTAEHGLKVSINLPSQRVSIQADASRLKQLVQNVLGNCIKYTDAPGEIRITLKAFKKGKQRMAELMIEDSSPGVDRSHLDKLFDHLYRVEASRNRQTGGSGLGLAICKQIVLAHQGDMTANASNLGGLKISIRLPLV
ncbi:MAG: two-component system sensor histidine kinase BaeS [Oleiphilaceae bacterium]|jgi:two-component system sensor histidine kinase BaeS